MGYYTKGPRQLADVSSGFMNTLLASMNSSGDSAQQVACINRANASSQVKAIDGEIGKLARSWNPTGYYRPSDVQRLLTMFANEAAKAGDALAKAPRSTSDAERMIREAFRDLQERYQVRAKYYETAVMQAASSGINVIDGPNLKDWVLDSMRAISDAYVTATVMRCRQSWIESLLDTAYRAIASIGAVAYAIGGVVYVVGQAVVKAADVVGSIAAVVIKYAPVAIVGLGAYVVYQKTRKR